MPNRFGTDDGLSNQLALRAPDSRLIVITGADDLAAVCAECNAPDRPGNLIIAENQSSAFDIPHSNFAFRAASDDARSIGAEACTEQAAIVSQVSRKGAVDGAPKV